MTGVILYENCINLFSLNQTCVGLLSATSKISSIITNIGRAETLIMIHLWNYRFLLGNINQHLIDLAEWVWYECLRANPTLSHARGQSLANYQVRIFRHKQRAFYSIVIIALRQ